ncbi:MAG: hypothetical protein ACK55Z_35110, partial [bacterium]
LCSNVLNIGFNSILFLLSIMNRNPNANDAIIEKVVGNRQVKPSYYIIAKHAKNEECVKV